MIRGTRILQGTELAIFDEVISICTNVAKDYGYEKVVFPNISELGNFTEKVSEEIADRQMWNFQDKKGRDVVLNPEITALYQKNIESLPDSIYYCQKCYRYERPQKGRYREFTQFGVESNKDDMHLMKLLANNMMEEIAKVYDIDYTFNDSVKRGLLYYTEDGFEVECGNLGAQKQVLGGGTYKEGCGFAIGIDRIVVSIMERANEL